MKRLAILAVGLALSVSAWSAQSNRAPAEAIRDIKATAAAAQSTTYRDGKIVAQVSLNCGIAPIPPIGCTVGPCVCDSNGNNCRWTFICK